MIVVFIPLLFGADSRPLLEHYCRTTVLWKRRSWRMTQVRSRLMRRIKQQLTAGDVNHLILAKLNSSLGEHLDTTLYFDKWCLWLKEKIKSRLNCLHVNQGWNNTFVNSGWWWQKRRSTQSTYQKHVFHWSILSG